MKYAAYVVAGGFLVAGAVLAVATTTSNRLRWAVQAPAAFGTGMLILAVTIPSWSPVAVMAGMYFYAALNYRNYKKGRLRSD